MEIPFNLLLLPFLGGYIFVRFWNFTRISILRADKDRIVIRASLAGLFALFVAFGLSILVPEVFVCSPNSFCFYNWWAENVKYEFTGVSIIAFLVASVGWIPLNLIFSRERAVDRAILEDGDPFEVFLKRAKDHSLSLAITMANEKVYIGMVTHQFNPATPTDNIGIMPLHSGYRDPGSKQMYLRLNYAIHLQNWTNQIDKLSDEINSLENDRAEIFSLHGKAAVIEHDEKLETFKKEWLELKRRVNSFVVILPVNQIASAFIFDQQIYEECFELPTEPETLEN